MQGCRALQGDPLPPLLSCLGTDQHLKISISKGGNTNGADKGVGNMGENGDKHSGGENTEKAHFLF